MIANADALAWGSRAPDFSLPGVDGRLHTLAGVAGPSGTVIMFICNHCPYVKSVAERIARDVRDLRVHGIGAVAINSNDPVNFPEDSFDNMKRFATAHGFDFPYVFDETAGSMRRARIRCPTRGASSTTRWLRSRALATVPRCRIQASAARSSGAWIDAAHILRGCVGQSACGVRFGQFAQEIASPSGPRMAAPPHDPLRHGRLNITPTDIAASAMPMTAITSSSTGTNASKSIRSLSRHRASAECCERRRRTIREAATRLAHDEVHRKAARNGERVTTVGSEDE